MGQVQRNTLCPEWDEAFVFDLGGRRATDLTLELLDWWVGSSELGMEGKWAMEP